jgi:PilZ domain-containing protein
MDRRDEPRTDRADNLAVTWVDKTGPQRQEALLLNISRSGARLHVHQRIAVGTQVEIVFPKGALPGTVRHCSVSKPNHNLGVSFRPGVKWSYRDY